MTFENNEGATVSIIVPTFNRRDRLARLLLNLEQACGTGTRFEVVVSVDGATDGTLEMLAELHTGYPLRVLAGCNRGPGAARNRAMAAAGGDILLFLDDDIVPVEGLIEQHLAVHRQDAAGVVVGPMLAPPGLRMAPWLRWEAATLHKQYDALIAGRYKPSPHQFYTANASVRREHALAVGGFDERFTRAEDVEFAFRLRDHGLRFYFVWEAAVLHEPDRTFERWLPLGYEYGRYTVLMAERGLVQNAVKDITHRHPLNRVAARWCVGHPWRMRLISALFSRLITCTRPRALAPTQVALCSALFNLQFWQGVADASGFRADVWTQIERQANEGSARADRKG